MSSRRRDTATRTRAIILTALVLLIAGAGYAYWTRSNRDGAGGYVTEAVGRGSIKSVVTATGTVNPVTSVQVGTYVSGPIRAIYADFNSPVTKGQLVAKIDPALSISMTVAGSPVVANAPPPGRHHTA